jgi:hypothetical protein
MTCADPGFEMTKPIIHRTDTAMKTIHKHILLAAALMGVLAFTVTQAKAQTETL